MFSWGKWDEAHQPPPPPDSYTVVQDESYVDRYLNGELYYHGAIVDVPIYERDNTRCRDGWHSPSIGQQGACSWHGGVGFLVPTGETVKKVKEICNGWVTPSDQLIAAWRTPGRACTTKAYHDQFSPPATSTSP